LYFEVRIVEMEIYQSPNSLWDSSSTPAVGRIQALSLAKDAVEAATLRSGMAWGAMMGFQKSPITFPLTS